MSISCNRHQKPNKKDQLPLHPYLPIHMFNQIIIRVKTNYIKIKGLNLYQHNLPMSNHSLMHMPAPRVTCQQPCIIIKYKDC